jgi:hypothetical protein
VDVGLEAVGSENVSVVAGDFGASHVIRLAPVPIATDRHAALATDQVMVRCVLRGDGIATNAAALRGLVGP